MLIDAKNLVNSTAFIGNPACCHNASGTVIITASRTTLNQGLWSTGTPHTGHSGNTAAVLKCLQFLSHENDNFSLRMIISACAAETFLGPHGF